jgi:thiamine biosynthesis lipoprotein ApbE
MVTLKDNKIIKEKPTIKIDFNAIAQGLFSRRDSIFSWK